MAQRGNFCDRQCFFSLSFWIAFTGYISAKHDERDLHSTYMAASDIYGVLIVGFDLGYS